VRPPLGNAADAQRRVSAVAHDCTCRARLQTARGITVSRCHAAGRRSSSSSADRGRYQVRPVRISSVLILNTSSPRSVSKSCLARAGTTTVTRRAMVRRTRREVVSWHAPFSLLPSRQRWSHTGEEHRALTLTPSGSPMRPGRFHGLIVVAPEIRVRNPGPDRRRPGQALHLRVPGSDAPDARTNVHP
jgi:hypothetical protein